MGPVNLWPVECALIVVICLYSLKVMVLLSRMKVHRAWIGLFGVVMALVIAAPHIHRFRLKYKYEPFDPGGLQTSNLFITNLFYAPKSP